MEITKQNLNIQKWVLAVAVALFLIKGFAYFLTRSVAVLTDALESIVNIIAAVITLVSLSIAAKPSDKNHPYGHGKAEFVAAEIEGILILLAAIAILYKAIHQIIYPSPLNAVKEGIGLIAFTAVVNWTMGSICIRKGKKNHSLALVASGKHLQTDTYSTIAVIASLLLVYLFKWEIIDSVVSIALSLFIGYTGYKIIKSSLAGIMDQADEEVLDQIIQEVNKARQPDWIDLHHLRVIKYGGTFHIDCHLTLPWYFTVRDAHKEVDALSQTIRNFSTQPIELMVHADDCKPQSCKICFKTDCHVRQHPSEAKIDWNFESVTTNSRHYLPD
ncbi:cation diffusion facilitator family transporter [Gynurincola endophyticus]|uniref:cation diffusion facilitator family transporter n=1 Tax=Gynurincola endophyticus TaxID=2479004 RepID=UPI000F8D32F2|nr:cation diffusion facilitator family transporter [Gynurincola endophyticus]